MKRKHCLFFICFLFASISSDAQRFISVDVKASKILFDARRDKLFAIINGTDSIYGNNILQIDPNTGAIEKNIFVGSEPNEMEMTKDSNYIYIGLSGASFVKRINIDSFVVDRSIFLGNGPLGPYSVSDLATLNISNELVVVSKRYANFTSSAFAGTAAYFKTVELPQVVTWTSNYNDRIESDVDTNLLFGTEVNSSWAKFCRMSVDTINGVSVIDVTDHVLSGDFILRNHLAYAPYGKVVDPYLPIPDTVGTYLFSILVRRTSVEPDAKNNKTYFGVYDDSLKIYTYDIQNYNFIDDFYIPVKLQGSSSPAIINLLRFQSRGLAFILNEDHPAFRNAKIVLFNSCLPHGASNISVKSDSSIYHGEAPDTIAIKFIISNNGDSAASNVLVLDTLPSTVSVVSISATHGTITSTGNIINWQISNMPSPQTDTANILLRILNDGVTEHKIYSSTSTFDCNSSDDTTSYKFDLTCNQAYSYFQYNDLGLFVRFQNFGPFNLNWFWDFDDGTFDSIQNPEHTFLQSGIYNVCLSTSNYCDSDSYCQNIHVESIGIEELNLTDLSYTNPIHDNFSLRFNMKKGSKLKLKIVNENGRIMMFKLFNPIIGPNKFSFNVTDFTPGVYFLNLIADHQSKWIKIIKQ